MPFEANQGPGRPKSRAYSVHAVNAENDSLRLLRRPHIHGQPRAIGHNGCFAVEERLIYRQAEFLDLRRRAGAQYKQTKTYQ